ncbi:MAG: class I SAM-dependent methyltransferase [Candidatus Odinarchaeota archaeon]
MNKQKIETANYGWYHKNLNILLLAIGIIGLCLSISSFFLPWFLNIICFISGLIINIFFLWPALGLLVINLISETNKTHPTTCLPEIISLDSPKILDIGCGTGRVAINMAKNMQNGGHIYGIDIFSEAISNNSLQTVQRNAQIEGVEQKTTFKFGAATEIPFEDDFFDVVNISYVMHEIPDKDKVLTEISRVMKQNGTFYLTEFDRSSLFTILVNGIYSSIFKKNDYWIKLLKRNGFKAINYEKLGVVALFIAKKEGSRISSA